MILFRVAVSFLLVSRDDLLEQRQRALEAFLADVDIDQRLGGLDHVRVELLRLLVVAQRGHQIIEALVVDAPDLGVVERLLRQVTRVIIGVLEHLDDRLPVGAALVDRAERVDGQRVGRLDLEGRAVRLLGARIIHDLRVEDIPHALVELDLLVGVRGCTSEAIVDIDGGLPVARQLVERAELAHRIGLDRLVLQRAHEGVDSRVLIIEPVAMHARQLVQELHGHRAIIGQVDVRLDDIHQLEPALERVVEALEVLDRGLVRRVDAQHVGVVIDGGVVVLVLLLVERGELAIDQDLLIGLEDGLELSVQDLEHIVPLGVCRVEALERLERGHVPLLVGEQVGVGADGARWVVELLFVNDRDPVADIDDHLRVIGRVDLLTQDVDEILPATVRFIDALEALEREQVRLVQADDLLVAHDRLVDLGELLLVDLAELSPELDLLVRVDRELDARVQRLRELWPTGHAPVEILEALQDVDVLGVHRERALEVIDRVVWLVEFVGEQAASVAAQVDRVALVLDDREHVVVTRDDLAKEPRLARQALELFDRLLVVYCLGDKSTEQDNQRGLGLLELNLEHLRGALQRLEPLEGLIGDDIGVRQIKVHERIRGLLARLVLIDLLERVIRTLVMRVELEDVLVELRGAIIVHDLVREQLGDLLANRQALFLGDVVELHIQDGDGLFPVTFLQVEALERLQREVVARIEQHHLIPGLDRLLRLHQHIGLDIGLLDPEVEATLWREALVLEHLGERARELEVIAAARVQVTHRLERGQVVLVDRERGLPRLERAHVIIEALAPDDAQVLVERQTLFHIIGEVDLALDDIDELLPALLLHVQAAQPPERVAVLRLEHDHAIEQLDRIVLLLEHLLGDPRLLREQVGLTIWIGRAANLAREVAIELLPLLGRQVQLLERLERFGVHVIEIEHAAEVLDGVLWLGQHVAAQATHAQVEFDELDLVVDLDDASLEDLAELLPALLPGVNTVERSERLGLARIERQHLEVGAFGVIRRSKLLLDGASQPQPESQRVCLFGLRFFEDRHVGLRHVWPLLVLGGDALELLAHIEIRRDLVERGRERLDRVDGLPHLLDVNARDLHIEAMARLLLLELPEALRVEVDELAVLTE